jgi:hypothetical protein
MFVLVQVFWRFISRPALGFSALARLSQPDHQPPPLCLPLFRWPGRRNDPPLLRRLRGRPHCNSRTLRGIFPQERT